jgi:hypothetical protein
MMSNSVVGWMIADMASSSLGWRRSRATRFKLMISPGCYRSSDGYRR